MSFPVFARRGTPMTARGRLVEVSVNQPVEIAGVASAPGDLVLVDGSGVVFVLASEAKEVLAVTKKSPDARPS